MIDDVPYWIASHSEIALLGVPMDAVSHVEVIRGPGSVIHGSNASAAVIKVVTLKEEGNRASLSVGSHDQFSIGGRYFNKFNPGHFLSFSIEHKNDGGYLSLFEDFDGTNVVNTKQVRKEEYSAFIAQYQQADFNLQVQAFESEKTGITRITPLIQPSGLEKQGYFVHASQKWKTDINEIKLYGDYNNFHLNFPTENDFSGQDTTTAFQNDGKDNYRIRAGINLNTLWSENISSLLGLESESRSIGEYEQFDSNTNEFIETVIPKTRRDEHTLFTQIDTKIKSLRLLLGARYIKNDAFGNKLVPRSAAIYELNNSESIKLLYSEGFNSPNFRQTDISLAPILTGNKNLKAETVKNIDLAYTRTTDNELFVANIYYIETKDFIERESSSFINTDSNIITGLELDFQRKTKIWSAWANASYIYKKDSVNQRDEFNLKVPDYTVSLGLSYAIQTYHSLGASFRYVGEMRHHTGTLSALSGYSLLNLSYQYRQEGLTWYATIKNSLDDDIRYPDLGIASQTHEVTTEGSPGSNYLLGAYYAF